MGVRGAEEGTDLFEGSCLFIFWDVDQYRGEISVNSNVLRRRLSVAGGSFGIFFKYRLLIFIIVVLTTTARVTRGLPFSTDFNKLNVQVMNFN